MYAPHTITVYNAVHETDAATFEETTKLYVTILRGVMLQASKAANVRESGRFVRRRTSPGYGRFPSTVTVA